MISFRNFLLENEGRINHLKKVHVKIPFYHDYVMTRGLNDKFGLEKTKAVMDKHSFAEMQFQGRIPKYQEQRNADPKTDDYEKEISHYIIDVLAAHDPSPN